jgi:hypothetical protein
MSSSPECTRCGDYVHSGPCLCSDCSRKLITEHANYFLSVVLTECEQDEAFFDALRPKLEELAKALI